MGEKVMVAMSGGVDSSVAALLLLEQGHTVAGMTMRQFDSDAAVCEARAVADRLGIPHHTVELGDAFNTLVIAPFMDAYAAGETPNPCVICNDRLKFGRLLQLAEEMGYDYLATGHYVRRVRDEKTGAVRLYKAADRSKDQSYFLYRLGAARLERVLFPLGELTKPQVRAIAAQKGLVQADKPESQDICFIPDGDYRAFMAERGRVQTPGDFIDGAGRVLGRHKGVAAYTVGQRKGLGISAPEPLYVVAKNPRENTVTLGGEAALYRDTLYVRDAVFFDERQKDERFYAETKIRYSPKGTPASVTVLESGRCRVEFDAAQRAPAPGQSAVFYDGDRLLGGGIIE